MSSGSPFLGFVMPRTEQCIETLRPSWLMLGLFSMLWKFLMRKDLSHLREKIKKFESPLVAYCFRSQVQIVMSALAIKAVLPSVTWQQLVPHQEIIISPWAHGGFRGHIVVAGICDSFQIWISSVLMSQSLVQYFQTSGNIFLVNCAIWSREEDGRPVCLMNFFSLRVWQDLQ